MRFVSLSFYRELADVQPLIIIDFDQLLQWCEGGGAGGGLVEPDVFTSSVSKRLLQLQICGRGKCT